jgi:xanthine dehydrogenase accessory factor
MPNILETALELSRQGVAVALATIVKASGSTPRAAGTKMLILADGSIRGTIGGGEMERRVIAEAQEVLAAGGSRLLHYEYREVVSGDPGICGGENDVFIECLAPPRQLLIVGSGHVGQAVAQVAALLGWQTVIFDNRPEWASRERFPQAQAIEVGDVAALLADYPINRSSYIVIASRGHLEDAAALAAVVRQPAAYIGMIGSRRKNAMLFEMLRAQGIEEEYLQRVYAPIGLPIGGETPEEIAVSIMAQIIAKVHGQLPEPNAAAVAANSAA